MQAKAPVEQIAMYLDGFHVAKDDPAVQMEAHHYCNQVNEDLAQCVLFDGNTAAARLTGVEYIISEKLYKTLPAEEKAVTGILTITKFSPESCGCRGCPT